MSQTRFEFVCDVHDSIEGEGPWLHSQSGRTKPPDPSAMTRDEAAALLDGRIRPICARLTLDAELEPVIAPPRSPTRLLALASGAMLAAGALAAAVWAAHIS